MKLSTCISTLLVISGLHLMAQDASQQADSSRLLHVYIDCQSCDMEFLAENLSVGTLVNDPGPADVHVLFSELTQAGGTATSSIILKGFRRFEALTDTLAFHIPADASPDIKRNIQLDNLRMGLVPYLMKTPEATRLFLFIDEETIEEAITKDPWGQWVFDIMGMGSYTGEKNNTHKYMNMSLSVSRITRHLKIESLSNYDYRESHLTYFDPDSNKHELTSSISTFSSQNLLVKSLGDHFGIGGLMNIMNDPTNNLKLRYGLGPAIEYNLFPYEKALQKQFRFLYSLVYEQSDYVGLSIYNKMNDRAWRQSLHIISQFNQPWGYFEARLTGASYLNDPSRYSVGGFVMSSIRIPKLHGLSFNFSTGVSMYRDKINQAKGYATLEDIYSLQRTMETDFQISFSFGFSFRFGSKKYPPVNPRFSR